MAIREAMLVAFKLEDSFHIVHYSIQRSHIHMIVEAKDRLALEKGMQVFGISAAKQINAGIRSANGTRRRGTVFADRYHAVILTSPRQVRNTLCYVLNNWRHHGEDKRQSRRSWKIDPYSSALACGHALSSADRLRRTTHVASEDLAVERRLAKTGAHQRV